MFEQPTHSSRNQSQPSANTSPLQPSSQPRPIPVRSTGTPPWMNTGGVSTPLSPTNGGQPQVSPLQQTPTAQRVYTIPEKFLPKVHPQPVHSGIKRLVLIVGVILAILIILVATLVYFLQTRTTPAAQPNQNVQSNSTSSQRANSNENQNGNANQNTPQNSNQNNTNIANVNGNENLNNTINQQLFPNSNQNTNNSNGNNTNSTTNSSLVIPSRTNISNAPDKDGDGLTDEEETSVYQTKSNLPDTDSDGYVDATEIVRLFSPLKAKQTLLESTLVIQENSKEFGWSIYYPAKWLAEKLDDNAQEVLFTPDTIEGEFMEVIVETNAKKQSAAEWYAALFPNMKVQDVQTATVGGRQGVVSEDGLAYYIADDQYIIGIIYNTGTSERLHFRKTFDMMVASFSYTPVAPKQQEGEKENANTNNNGNKNNNTNSNSNSNTNGNTNNGNNNTNS